MNYIHLNNRRYLGSKYKLLGEFEEIIQPYIEEIDSVADVFAGTGVVGEFFLKKHKDVIFNDILASNEIIYHAWFGKGTYSEEKLKKYLDKWNNLDGSQLVNNYFSDNFSDTYFSHAVCKVIGYIREEIETEYETDRINEREKAILISSLLYSADRIANTVGHYDAFIDKIKPLESKLELYLPKVQRYDAKIDIFRQDANQLVRNIEADLVYIDPPYNSRQYGDMYHLLDNLVEWKKPNVQYKARKMNRQHLKSNYSQKEASIVFHDLIENINAKYILVSYNNTGSKGNIRSQAKIPDNELLSVLEKKGKVSVFEKKYNMYTTGKSAILDNKERFFLCVVNPSKKKQLSPQKNDKELIVKKYVKTVFNYTGGKYKLLTQLDKIIPFHMPNRTFIDLFSGGGNVGINIVAQKIIYNDINNPLVRLFRLLKKTDFGIVDKKLLKLIEEYSLSHSNVHGYGFYQCDSSKGLGRYNKKPYLRLRADYNAMRTSEQKDLMLLLLIMYSFNNQIRFNANLEFNMPVGKRDYNSSIRNNLFMTIEKLRSINIQFFSKDYKKINIRDYALPFVYCDPPYSMTTAPYNENGGWNKEDDLDLMNFLDNVDNYGVPFALSNVSMHHGVKNETLLNWVIEKGYSMHALEHHYNNSSYQKKNRQLKTTEVLITNYLSHI